MYMAVLAINKDLYPTSTQDAAKKTDQERWMIGMDGERESRNTVLTARLNDDDDDDDTVHFLPSA